MHFSESCKSTFEIFVYKSIFLLSLIVDLDTCFFGSVQCRHCYGFHLIPGGEGRKDPFSSLLRYLPTALTDIFYDFVCQLSEYCLDREPQYFLHTKFWHDLFHGINHKCGKCFKSSRICGMVGINSEICEQLNSFLQSMKYTGSHLSKSHFMFFVQSFIYQWRKDCKV